MSRRETSYKQGAFLYSGHNPLHRVIRPTISLSWSPTNDTLNLSQGVSLARSLGVILKSGRSNIGNSSSPM